MSNTENNNENKKITLGIDLGTTNSAAFYLNDKNKLVNIHTKKGNKTFPSVVAFSENGKVQIGEAARRQIVVNRNTITKIKSQMGKNTKTLIGAKNYSPEEISSFILMQIKILAKKQTGQEIRDVIITVPAYFSNAQREKTQIAAKMAGLNPMSIINEPTAATLSIEFQNPNLFQDNKQYKFLVYDFGGGTFDVSILDKKNKEYNVVGTGGDKQLGGDNVDMQILHDIIKTLNKDNKLKIDIKNEKNSFVVKKILLEIEEMKKSFSNDSEYRLAFPSLSFFETSKLLSYNELFTKTKFNKIVTPVVTRTIDILNKTLKEVNLGVNDIDLLFLVGGSCKLEIVKKEILKVFPKEKVIDSIDLDLSVGMGAAVYSSIVSGSLQDGTTISDVTSMSVGVANSKGLVIKVIPKNTTIPFSKEIEFHTSEENQEEVTVRVVEGENNLADNCEEVGSFTLSNLTRAPKGAVKISVKFMVDKNGIFTISASEKGLGGKTNAKAIKIKKQTTDKNKIEKLSKIVEEEGEKTLILLDRFDKIIDSYSDQLREFQSTGDVKMEKTVTKILTKYYDIQKKDTNNPKVQKKIEAIVKNFNKQLLKTSESTKANKIKESKK